MKIDLHVHSTASDGTDAPEEIASVAKDGGISAIALTDHDTMSGVDAAIAAGLDAGIRVLPGIELSAGGGFEVHILGYNMRSSDTLQTVINRMQRQRDVRMREMVKKLNKMRMHITSEQVMGFADGAVGRPHLARALVESGYVHSVKEAFARYLSPGKPAFVPREKLSVADAVQLVHQCGGIPALAHPGIIEVDQNHLLELIRAWKAEGLLGIEAHHPAHTPDQCLRFDKMARGLDLLVTGGSDYHGAVKQTKMGSGMDLWRDLPQDFAELLHQMGLLMA